MDSTSLLLFIDLIKPGYLDSIRSIISSIENINAGDYIKSILKYGIIGIIISYFGFRILLEKLYDLFCAIITYLVGILISKIRNDYDEIVMKTSHVNVINKDIQTRLIIKKSLFFFY